jgi:spore coat polysaccharide biosynthesis protein SpsF (cytidylyltransferase family)
MLNMKNKKKILCIIQARMTSSRLPGKSMKDLSGKPAIQRVIERAMKSSLISDFWLACSNHKEDDILEGFAIKNNINIYRGSMNDVLSRYVYISKKNDSDIIVRITGDCPLIDPEIIDLVIKMHMSTDSDYTSNTLTRSYPDGLDVEVFSSIALYGADLYSNNSFMREHVTPYIHGRLSDRFPSGDYKREQLVSPIDYSKYRWTLDEEKDLIFLNKVFNNLNDHCTWKDVINLLEEKPELVNINKGIKFNEGSLIGLRNYKDKSD